MKPILILALLAFATTASAQDPTPTLPDNGAQQGDHGTHVYWDGGEVHAPSGSSVSVNAPAPYVAYRPRFFFRPRLARAYWIGRGRPVARPVCVPPRVKVNVY